jgi:hypothetical protein
MIIHFISYDIELIGSDSSVYDQISLKDISFLLLPNAKRFLYTRITSTPKKRNNIEP